MVADMVADMEVDMVADMELDMVAVLEVEKVAKIFKTPRAQKIDSIAVPFRCEKRVDSCDGTNISVHLPKLPL